MSNQNEPAFPAQPLGTDGKPVNEMATGLTKREFVAAMALQGYCANSSHAETGTDKKVFWAIEDADALLGALEPKDEAPKDDGRPPALPVSGPGAG